MFLRAGELARWSGLELIQVPIGPERNPGDDEVTLHLFPRSESPLREHPHNHTSVLEIVRIIPPEWVVEQTIYEPTTDTNGEPYERVANVRVRTESGRTVFIEVPLGESRLRSWTQQAIGPLVVGETIDRGIIHSLSPRPITATADKCVVTSFVKKTDFAQTLTPATRSDWTQEHKLDYKGADRLEEAISGIEEHIRKGTLTDSDGMPVDATELAWTTMVYLRPGEQLKPFMNGDTIAPSAEIRMEYAKAGLQKVLFGRVISEYLQPPAI